MAQYIDRTKNDYLPNMYWTDNPQGVSESYPYEIVAVRKKTKNSDGNPEWGDFSNPVLWATYQKGEKGEKGDTTIVTTNDIITLLGQSPRIREWNSAYNYYAQGADSIPENMVPIDDEQYNGKSKYYDIVYHNSKTYLCKKSHKGSSRWTDAYESEYWTEATEYDFIKSNTAFFKNLIAEKVDATTIRADQLVIGSNTAPTAGMIPDSFPDNEYQKIRIFAGDIQLGGIANAKFRVYSDGRVVANKGIFTGTIHAESGEFKGKVEATSFQVNDSGLKVLTPSDIETGVMWLTTYGSVKNVIETEDSPLYNKNIQGLPPYCNNDTPLILMKSKPESGDPNFFVLNPLQLGEGEYYKEYIIYSGLDSQNYVLSLSPSMFLENLYHSSGYKGVIKYIESSDGNHYEANNLSGHGYGYYYRICEENFIFFQNGKYTFYPYNPSREKEKLVLEISLVSLYGDNNDQISISQVYFVPNLLGSNYYVCTKKGNCSEKIYKEDGSTFTVVDASCLISGKSINSNENTTFESLFSGSDYNINGVTTPTSYNLIPCYGRCGIDENGNHI